MPQPQPSRSTLFSRYQDYYYGSVQHKKGDKKGVFDISNRTLLIGMRTSYRIGRCRTVHLAAREQILAVFGSI